MFEFTQHPAISRRQKRSIQRIQQHLRNYRDNPYIKLTNQEITQYLWHLGAIITITTDHKIALKAIAVDKVLRKIRIYRREHGTPVVPKRPAIPSKRNHPTSSNRSTDPQKMEKLLQTISPSEPNPLSENQVVTPSKSDKEGRNRPSNFPLPQRSARRTSRDH